MHTGLSRSAEWRRLAFGDTTTGHRDLDWAAIIGRYQETLPKSGSGQPSGTIVIPDAYPLSRTLKVGAHVELLGAERAGHHLGGSCGFRRAAGKFEGGPLLEWNRVGGGYSNFGAGLRQIHIETGSYNAGAVFTGAQQSAGIENLVIRGCKDGAQLHLRGDTYAVRDVLLDASRGQKGDNRSAVHEGAHGLDTGGQRIQSITMDNITVHNCEVGMMLGNAAGVEARGYESEIVREPVKVYYTATGVRFTNSYLRGASMAANIARVAEPSVFGLHMQGLLHSNRGKYILLQGEKIMLDPATRSEPQPFEFHLDGYWDKAAGRFRVGFIEAQQLRERTHREK